MDEVPTVSAAERSEDRRAEVPRGTAARGRDLRAAAAWLQLGERPTAGGAAGAALISAALGAEPHAPGRRLRGLAQPVASSIATS